MYIIYTYKMLVILMINLEFYDTILEVEDIVACIKYIHIKVKGDKDEIIRNFKDNYTWNCRRCN